ncbi:MAG: hypothetical protein WC071_06570 [Victivallaceae bacterium]
MNNSIQIALMTYSLAAVVSLLVAVIIHFMCLTIKRFFSDNTIPEADASISQQGGTMAASGNAEEEIASAVIAVKLFMEKANN